MPQFFFRDNKTKQIFAVALDEAERDRLTLKFSGKRKPNVSKIRSARKCGITAPDPWDLGEVLPAMDFSVEEDDKYAARRRTVSFYPWHSDGAGVNPDQIPEAYAQSVKDGCPTQFDDQGRAIFTSPRHRDRYLKANGIFDRRNGQRETAGPSSSIQRRA